jgi:hypothetical protein
MPAITRFSLLLLLSLLIVPAAVQSQEQSDSVRFRNDCRLAAQVVRTGHPRPHTQWAFQRIHACGTEGAAALAERLAGMRNLNDKAEWQSVTFPAFRDMRDRRMYEVSLSIATDESATEVARGFAFRNLLWLVAPSADLESFDPWNAPGLGCIGSRFEVYQAEGEPLPSDARDRIRAAARHAAAASSAPSAVRKSAICVLVYGGWRSDVR